MSVVPVQIPVSTSVPALTLAAGTTGGVAVANSIDPVNDYALIYTASATATQGINRNTLLGLSSQPLGKTDVQTGISNKTFVAPVLGAATATSINGLTLTSSTGTISITNGKTLAVSNTLTLAGTDSTTMTFPGTSDTVMTLGATQTGTNKTFTSPAIGTSILDTNSNTLVGLTATASAVNYLNIADSITANAPVLSAKGSDTNINIALTAKGTGFIQGTPPVWQYLEYAQITTNFAPGSGGTTPQQVTGLTVTVTVPAGYTKVKVTAFSPTIAGDSSSAHTSHWEIWSGTVNSGTRLQASTSNVPTSTAGFGGVGNAVAILPATTYAGSQTFNVGMWTDVGNPETANVSSTSPAFILVEVC